MFNEYYGASAKARDDVNRILGLVATGKEQDWEVEFADAKMIDIMLDALEKEPLSIDAKSALCLLTISSFEESFGLGKEDYERISRAARLIEADTNVLERMRFYWIELKRASHPELIKILLSA